MWISIHDELQSPLLSESSVALPRNFANRFRSCDARYNEEMTKLAALHWWGERTEPSARSPSVLAHYVTLTSMAFDLAIGVVGRCTFSTPSRKSAVTFVLSASSGSVKLRRKVPKHRSIRWNFFF